MHTLDANIRKLSASEIAQVSGGKNSGSAFPPTNGPFFPRGTGVPSGGNGGQTHQPLRP
jgi:hypothetical protein